MSRGQAYLVEMKRAGKTGQRQQHQQKIRWRWLRHEVASAGREDGDSGVDVNGDGVEDQNTKAKIATATNRNSRGRPQQTNKTEQKQD